MLFGYLRSEVRLLCKLSKPLTQGAIPHQPPMPRNKQTNKKANKHQGAGTHTEKAMHLQLHLCELSAVTGDRNQTHAGLV